MTFGYMSSYKCVHDVAPDFGGAKVIPGSLIRIDKRILTTLRFSVWIRSENTGFVPVLNNKIIVTVYVIFNEIIPNHLSILRSWRD